MKYLLSKLKLEKLAEFVGIILGDGCIRKYDNYTSIKISLNSETDWQYSLYVKKLILSLFKIEPIVKQRKDAKAVELFIFKRDVINFLTKDLGMATSPKRGKAKIPKLFLNTQFENFILRGYFDTDGCVVLTNNNGSPYIRLEMKISPSPMQSQFIDILKRKGFHFGVYKVRKDEVRVQLNGKEQLKKWANLVGFSNTKHIKRIKK